MRSASRIAIAAAVRFDECHVEAAIERLVALLCFVFGVSHVVQPRTWSSYS
jgi:hypothetical protein